MSLSSLRGWASRVHFQSFSKSRDSTSVLKALPGKLDIKRHSPSILYVYHGWIHQQRGLLEAIAHMGKVSKSCAGQIFKK